MKETKLLLDYLPQSFSLASVQDIADGNMVSLLVFPEGKGPENSVPIASFPCTVKGGSVSARWSHRSDQSGMPPEENPRFIFTAHCAWCNFEKSSNTLEVKLVRPEITKAEWRDKDGNPADKGLVGEALKLHAETKDLEGGVTFWIYDDRGSLAASIGADVKDNAADAEWTYHWDGIPLKEKPKFKFEVRGNRCNKIESGEVEISASIQCQLVDSNENPLEDYSYTIIECNDNSTDGTTDSDGTIKIEEIIPGELEVKIPLNNNEIHYYISMSGNNLNTNEDLIIEPAKNGIGSGIICNNQKLLLVLKTVKVKPSR